jgi:hypothetical protein
VRSNRRWYIGLAVACVVVAVAVAVGFVLAFGSGRSEAAPTKSQYFASVAAICRIYGPKLDKVPPPIDLTISSELSASAEKALPLLQAEADAVRRLAPPRELRASVERWITLNDRSIARLAATLPAARQKNVLAVQVAYVQFIVTGAKAQHLGKSIGFPSPPC